VGFDVEGFDQLPYARTLAKKYDTEHHEEHVHLDPMEAIGRLVRQFDEPFADSSALACLRLCEAASRHVKVVLTGDGGDESFAGYNRYHAIQEAAPEAGRLRRVVAASVLATSGALFSPEAKYLKRFRATLATPLDQHKTHQELFSEWLANRLLTPPYRGSVEDGDEFDDLRRRATTQGWQPLEVAQYVDLRMYLPEDILAKVDRTSMAHGLECRVPLLDHSITEFSARLSADLKIRGSTRKYLLKRVAERYVPHELLYRPKMGFRVPIRRWFKRTLRDRAAGALRDGALVTQGILEADGLEWLLRSQRRPWIDFGSHLWALLFFEHWARRYLFDGRHVFDR
jgi:asparagine synthase (glutamine-hydrolysing)